MKFMRGCGYAGRGCGAWAGIFLFYSDSGDGGIEGLVCGNIFFVQRESITMRKDIHQPTP